MTQHQQEHQPQASAAAAPARSHRPVQREASSLSIVFSASWIRLTTPIGEGAFSRVYEGVYRNPDTGDESVVAVKILKKSMLKRRSDCLRFIKEAKIMTRINHRRDGTSSSGGEACHRGDAAPEADNRHPARHRAIAGTSRRATASASMRTTIRTTPARSSSCRQGSGPAGRPRTAAQRTRSAVLHARELPGGSGGHQCVAAAKALRARFAWAAAAPAPFAPAPVLARRSSSAGATCCTRSTSRWAA